MFLPAGVTNLSPLFNATTGTSCNTTLKKDVEWTIPRIRAFQEAKSRLARAALLSHFIPGTPLALTTDASDYAVGAVLEQKVGDVWRPLGFYSSRFKPTLTEKYRPLQLTDAQRSATERELLAAYRAIQHFQHLLEGRPFTLFTDHRPLVAMMSKPREPKSAMQARHLALISTFTTDIRHIEGKKNAFADALSRVEIDAVSLGVDFSELAQAQLCDPELPAIRTAATSLKWKEVIIEDERLLCDVSTRLPRPWVPNAFRRPIFDQLHALSHPGIGASTRLVSSRLRSKVHRHICSNLDSIPITDTRFETIHVDLVGPLPPSQGATHLLTVVDRFTRWPEAYPIGDTTTKNITKTLISGWISWFGTPSVIISDRGPQFISQLWTEIAQHLAIKLHQTTAYHPQSKGMVEHFHRQSKTSITTCLTGPDWMQQLPWVLLGIRPAHKDDVGASPAELVYGTQLHLPSQFWAQSTGNPTATPFLEDLREAMSKLLPTPTTTHQPKDPAPTHIPQALQSCPMVWVRKDGHQTPLTVRYDGPYGVISREPKIFHLLLGQREDNVSIDRLKPATVAPETLPAQPPRRGRPRLP